MTTSENIQATMWQNGNMTPAQLWADIIVYVYQNRSNMSTAMFTLTQNLIATCWLSR